MASSLSSTLASSLSLGKDKQPENHLLINGPQRGMRTTPKFQDHKIIGKFQITKDQEYSEDSVEIPEIISPEKIRQLQGTNLGHGFATATKLTDYPAYHTLKQDLFFKWLSNNDYFTKVGDDKEFKKPEFICFGGRITDPLQTPLITRFGEWEIYAAKVKDCIFLWDEKTGSSHNRTIQSFYGIGFEALLTGQDPRTLNEFDKVFIVQEANFGSHQLLLVSEVDAVDANGDLIEIKTYKKASPKAMDAKYLGYWGQSVVAGVKKMVIGNRSEDGRLLGTESMSTEDALRKSNLAYSVSKCLDFEDRLLIWISSHFTKNEPQLIKKFVWTGAPSGRIECIPSSKTEVAASSFFPAEFLE